MRSNPLIWLCAVALILLAAGCSQKDIECGAAGERLVTVRFHWDAAPEASPDGMTLYFYPRSAGGKIWRFDIAGRDGGQVELPVGSYSLLAFNNDLPGVVIADAETFEGALCRMKLSGNVGTGTGMLYAGTVASVDVTPCGVRYITASGEVKECGMSLIRCYPEPRCGSYGVIVKNVRGMERVRSAVALFGGLAQEMLLASGECCGDAAQVSMGLTLQSADSLLTGASRAFGLCPGQTDFNVTLRVTRTDGVVLDKKFDVTRQVLTAPDRRRIVVIIDGLTIPSDTLPPEPGGDDDDIGIIVGVDGWTVINIDLTT